MTALERALLELDVEWPATPDLAAAVRARIVAEPEAAGGVRPEIAGGVLPETAGGQSPEIAGGPEAGIAPWWRWWPLAGWRRRVAAAVAALVLLGGGTLAASPAARSAVLRWLGLQGVEIREGKPSATPVKPSRLGETLGLGAPISIERARRAGALEPRGLGAPGAAYLGPLVAGQRAVALVYAPRAGLPPSKVTGVALLVQTFHATVEQPMIEKLVSIGDVRRLTVAGAPAYWIGGAAHGFMYETPAGGEFEPQRLADHTLLVESHGRLLRVEGPLTLVRAEAIAMSALID
jgi:hypothetical protein